MGSPANDAPDRITVVRNLISKKILELTKVVGAANSDGATVDSANDEIRLCRAWAGALNAADPASLPSAAEDQPLLDAITTVDRMINDSAAANQLAQATATLIARYKAPG
jgi:hypothetical protein